MKRLDQLLANLGYCSRRESRQWIEAGRVKVAGRIATDPGERVDAARVEIDGEPLDHPDGILLALNKPAGLVCSHEPGEGPSVFDLLPERWRARNPVIASVGRLDKETTGVLLLTDHSDLVHRLTSPRHKVPKVYRAILDRDPPAGLPGDFSSGTLMLDGEAKPCAPAELRIVNGREVEVVLTEGRYHQVRRMFAARGLTVLQLHRLRFGNISVEDLEPGKWRELPLGELLTTETQGHQA